MCKNNSNAQSFGLAASCNVNVNGPSWASSYDDIKRAVFKFSNGGNCTGVLINQYIPYQGHQQYFLSAWHCLSDVDPNSTFKFMFNYQSKDNYNSSIPLINQGVQKKQSDEITDDGYQCYFESTITIIDKWSLGDLALCRINQPIPPHFNVFYAGWITNSYTFSAGDFNLVYGTFKNISHPRGDIKKIARMDWMLPNNNPINIGCTVVTSIINTVVNSILGLFGGPQINTSIICNYVDVPYYVAPSTSVGTLEPGSSGSPLFTSGGQVLGCTSSGLFDPCVVVNDNEFSKFKNFYRYHDVRTSLNPSGNWTAANIGIVGRDANCYNELNLQGHYFPLGNYQNDNHLELHANNNVNVIGPLHIYAGGDYTFSAGGDINLGNDFTVDAVEDFSGVPGKTSNNCNPNSYRSSGVDEHTEALNEIIKSFPERKDLKLEEHTSLLNVFPNPSKGEITASVLLDEGFKIQVINSVGELIFEKGETGSGFANKIQINISDEPNGLYLIRVVSGSKKSLSKKIFKTD
jgi:hypothetical protein